MSSRSPNNVFGQITGRSISVLASAIQYRPVECIAAQIGNLGDPISDGHQRVSRLQSNGLPLEYCSSVQPKHRTSATQWDSPLFVSSKEDCPIVASIHIVHFSSGDIEASAKHRCEEIIWRKLPNHMV